MLRRDQLSTYLQVNRWMVGAALPVTAILHMGGPTNVFFLLEIVVAGYWFFLGWLGRQRSSWSDDRIVQSLCAMQWGVSMIVVSIEGWSIHIVPLFCVVPVLIATRSLSHSQYQRLVLMAVLVILSLTVWSRALGNGAIHDASSYLARDVFAISVTPALGAFISWLAWRNHRSMWLERHQIRTSRERLATADAEAAARFNTRTQDIGRGLLALVDCVPGSSRAKAASLGSEVQQIAQALRLTTQELGAPPIRVDVAADLEQLAQEVEQPVVISVGPLGSRLSVTDAVLRDVIVDLLRPPARPVRSRVEVRKDGDAIVLDLENRFSDAPRQESVLGVAAMDRLEAIGGLIEVHWDASSCWVRCQVPPASTRETVALKGERDLVSDLRYGLLFPIAALLMTIGLWMTFLPYDELRRVAIITAGIFTIPCLAAVVIGVRYPIGAIAVFSASHWLTAVVIAERLHIVKYFGAIALLIPLALALPYVGPRAYTLLTLGTCLATAAAIGLVRLDRQLEVVTGAPGFVSDIVVVALVPLASAVLLLLSHRNHQSASLSTDELRRSRRDLVSAAHHAQRTLERDLHDGAQQRLVSAALRLQIASRQKVGDEVQRNLELAAAELREAGLALRSLQEGRSLRLANGQELWTRLSGLRGPDGVDLHVRLDYDGPLTAEQATTLWFCCSESVANAMKHGAGVTEIDLEISPLGADGIRFKVSDDGGGMRLAPHTRSTGLLNMRERLRSHGGQLEIQSGRSGTIVSGSFSSGVGDAHTVSARAWVGGAS